MKIRSIIILLASLFIVGFLLYKILKANNLLPLTSTSTSMGKEERLIRWEEISAVKIKKNKLIINRGAAQPSTSESLALPSWMLSGFRQIEIYFNQEDERIPQLIKDYTGKKQ